MERLTNSIDFCQIHCDFGKAGGCFFKDKSHCYDNNIYNRLREYEIAEEQGLLLRLPCKVGDTVYWVYDCRMIREVIVYGFRVTPSKILMLDYSQFPFGNIGVDVFLTKEEAEQALADMKGEK